MKKKPEIILALEQVAQFIPFPLYWGDIDTLEVIGANQSCLDAMGAKSPEDVIGKTPYEYYPKEMADKIIEHAKKIVETKLTLSQEDIIKDITTGKIRYYTAIRAPLFDKDHNVVAIVGTSIETTSEKEAEKLKNENEKQFLLLEQQEKFRKIVDQVVHDIRSPIASMQMILPSCKKLPESERVSMNKAATRIMDIANRLLNEVKPAKQEVSDNKIVPTLISSEILEVIAEKRFEYKQKTIDFCAHISQDSYFAFLNINSSDFKRMLSNLINNAVDAIKNKLGKIGVYLEGVNNQVRVTVQDNGGGMAHEIREKLLNNVSVTAGKTDGHGIGFSQIHDALESCNGKLEIESTIGAGTKIILTFPLADSPDWIAQKIELFDDDTIIILDDDESIHGAWETKFKKAAPNIIRKHFEQGEEAITFINNLKPATKEKIFLLTDYELLDQGLHGLNVVKQTGITRSILVTSHHNSKEIRELAKLHNTQILPKPLAPNIPINISERGITVTTSTRENPAHRQVDVILADDDIEFSRNFARFMTAHERTVDKYNSTSEFVNNISTYSKGTLILIDNEFAQENITGIEIAKQLHHMGFSRLYLFSGRDYSNDSSIPTYLTPILKTDLDSVLRILNK